MMQRSRTLSRFRKSIKRSMHSMDRNGIGKRVLTSARSRGGPTQDCLHGPRWRILRVCKDALRVVHRPWDVPATHERAVPGAFVEVGSSVS